MSGDEMRAWLESDESMQSEHERRDGKPVLWRGIPALPFFAFDAQRQYVLSRIELVNKMAEASHHKTLRELGL